MNVGNAFRGKPLIVVVRGTKERPKRDPPLRFEKPDMVESTSKYFI